MHFGDGSFTAGILASLYLFGEINNDDRCKRAGMLGAESIVVNSILTGAIKLTLQRPLPNSGLSYDTWYPKWNSINDLAFPSGHTSSAFACSAIIATEFSDMPLIPILAYTTASLTAISMLDMNEHWGSDILPGAALGYYTGKKIESMQKRKSTQTSRGSSDLVFFPMVSGESVSVLCYYGF
jgi:membrane-associated phospholipid phosphatase